MAQNDQALLVRLKDSGLEFVVIGGVCVVFHGAPVATFDLDICCPFGEENVCRIESAVRDLHPLLRLTANKLPLDMTRSTFGDLKNLYLQTDLGKLDCLSEVAGVGDFSAVLKRSVLANFSYGQFRFLDIDALIDSKRAVGRERDLDAVRRLLAIKERNQR
jgi:hypothetical protein